MAHKPKIGKNFAPSKATLRGISSQAITRHQNELDSCSNPLKQGCQTYGPRAKTGPLCGWIRPAG